jgi:site-specific DNA-methyltransferase (cytosine-N4-specific)
MRNALLEWRGYKYFPYERQFAWMEAERLFGSAPSIDVAGLRVSTTGFRRAERLTYFARAVSPTGEVIVPHQTQLEASAVTGDGHKQATRYSAHGLHDYKGKFNPQIVRAIGNMLNLSDDAWVLDPFCGSGTTLLECAHTSWNAVGVDINPLGVLIANAKVHALRNADRLQHLGDIIQDRLKADYPLLSSLEPISDRVISAALGTSWQSELASWEYLASWFPRPVLAQIVALRRVLRDVVRRTADRAVFETLLSDSLRDASYQDPDDLRIRRRKNPRANYPLISWFCEHIDDRLKRVVRAQQAIGIPRGTQRAVVADARKSLARGMSMSPTAGFDAVITSPPYETALPYIDTQRLSLVLLGFVTASQIHATEKQLVGAREIGLSERRSIEALIDGDIRLPPSVARLAREMLRAASGPGNGFRRINRPALFFRYFHDMSTFFERMKPSLKPNAKVAIVIGSNRTVLGGIEFHIDTPSLLLDVARQHGFELMEKVAMQTYQRYDMHQRNSINDETLLVLQAVA